MKEVKSLGDISLPENGTIDLPRPDEDLRIPIKAISLEEQQRMAKDWAPPPAPKKFDKSGKMTENGKPGYYFDESDSVYQASLVTIREGLKRDATITALAFEVDGEGLDEKWCNLAKKLTMGDLEIILGAVNELSNITNEEVEQVKNS